MTTLAAIEMGTMLALAGIVVVALIAFWLLKKIVKLFVSLVIIVLIAVAAVIYCVQAGYISREDAAKLNPFNSEQVRLAVKDAGAWAGEQAKDAAKKAVAAAVDDALGRSSQTNTPAK